MCISLLALVACAGTGNKPITYQDIVSSGGTIIEKSVNTDSGIELIYRRLRVTVEPMAVTEDNWPIRLEKPAVGMSIPIYCNYRITFDKTLTVINEELVKDSCSANEN